MKRIVLLMITVVMLLSLCSCGGTKTTVDTSANVNTDSGNSTPTPAPQPETPSEPSSTGSTSDAEVKYVMIYNPKIYDQNNMFDTSSMKTGNISAMVDVDAFKASGLETERTFTPISQAELNEKVPLDKIDLSGNRGDILSEQYKVGDKKTFYCATESDLNVRTSQEFTCKYAGTNCNVWSAGEAVSDAKAIEYGKEFDSNIYNKVVNMFGQPRFTDNGGKINLLMYELEDGLAGFFYLYDIFATGEVTEAEAEANKMNLNHAIININSSYVNIPSADITTSMYGTMAHEFQHLICTTAALETSDLTHCRTWLNESMSGYIEEYLYKGSQEGAGRYEEYNSSGMIRTGQSLYNFETSMFDIGAYGSVYFFSEYLTKLAGQDVFTKIHSYWRDSYSITLCEAEALVNSVPSSVYNKIEQKYSFPSTVTFINKDEEWMSKLTLDFYIETLSNSMNVNGFDKIEQAGLLYDEINEAEIEGGGRIVFALKDGKFEIPADSESGLVYIGFDKDFKIVKEYK